uniref:DRBM domain-containing protein n=1 Tax=Falco tinnunculus TaxID=100819 RepID=A0A8C4U9A3_FALTI
MPRQSGDTQGLGSTPGSCPPPWLPAPSDTSLLPQCGGPGLAGLRAASRRAPLMLCLSAPRRGTPLEMKTPVSPPQSECNPVGALQELVVQKGWRLPEYTVTQESGPAHRKEFTMTCRVERFVEIGRGLGHPLGAWGDTTGCQAHRGVPCPLPAVPPALAPPCPGTPPAPCVPRLTLGGVVGGLGGLCGDGGLIPVCPPLPPQMR